MDSQNREKVLALWSSKVAQARKKKEEIRILEKEIQNLEQQNAWLGEIKGIVRRPSRREKKIKTPGVVATAEFEKSLGEKGTEALKRSTKKRKIEYVLAEQRKPPEPLQAETLISHLQDAPPNTNVPK